MSTQEINSLPLHDALLKSIELRWKERLCRFHFNAFARKGENASPHLLEFQAVTALKVPHEDSWGPSSSVNSVTQSSGLFQIEMQSGDTIEVAASGFTFVAL